MQYKFIVILNKYIYFLNQTIVNSNNIMLNASTIHPSSSTFQSNVVEIGNYVAVAWEDNWYPGKNPQLWFFLVCDFNLSAFLIIGLVEDKDQNGNLTIKFLSRNRKYFIWPTTIDDRHIIKEGDVICKCTVYPSSSRNFLVKEHQDIQQIYDNSQ